MLKKLINIKCIAILSAVFITAVWQILFVVYLPDGDTDAYAHHVIAREIIMNPGNLSVHWVWLPLFHYISAALIIIGAKMQTLRFFNIALTIAISYYTFHYTRKSSGSGKTAFFAFILTIFMPLGILMGTTAQPEPLFSLLFLVFIILFTSKKFILSSLILSFLSLLRYESWSVLFIIGIYTIIMIYKKRSIYLDDFGKNLSVYLNIILPVLAILFWSFLRYPYDGKFMGFIGGTKEFVFDALKLSENNDWGISDVFYDTFHYIFWIPFLFYGLNLFFIIPGLRDTIKNQKWLFIFGLGILAFISLSWIFKSNLGLNRHFTSLIPLYSIIIANGINRITDKNNIHRIDIIKWIYLKKRIPIKNIILFISGIICLFYLTMWLYIWWDIHKDGYPQREEAAVYLNSLNDDRKILCNDAVIEIISNIDYRRFDRFWMDDKDNTRKHIMNITEQHGLIYVVTTDNKLDYFEGLCRIIYKSDFVKNSGRKIIILKSGEEK